MGSRNAAGYGRFRPIPGGKWTGAHRIAWELTNAQDAGELFVCHRCDNKSCCNPDHLFLGTPADNVQDMVDKGRQARGFTFSFTKTTPEQRAEIVARYDPKAFPGKIRNKYRSNAVELAAEYGICKGYVQVMAYQARRGNNGQ